MASAKSQLKRFLEIMAISAAVDIGARILAHWFWEPFFTIIAGLAFLSFIMALACAGFYGVRAALARRNSPSGKAGDGTPPQ